MVTIKQFLKKLRSKKKKSKTCCIKADLLHKDSVLEDAEIGDEDTVLIEYKLNGE